MHTKARKLHVLVLNNRNSFLSKGNNSYSVMPSDLFAHISFKILVQSNDLKFSVTWSCVNIRLILLSSISAVSVQHWT